MTAFTDAMTAVVAAIKAGQNSVDPAHIASIDASIADLKTKQTADEASEATDAGNIADIQAGLNILTTGLAAPAVPTPAAPPAA